jgi:hypothetical protein
MKYLILSLVLGFNVQAKKGEVQVKELFWYKGTCTQAQIDTYTYTKTKDKPLHTTKKISDPAEIKKMTDLLDKLPTAGDIMISMAPPNLYTVLKLTCGSAEYSIEVFDELIKTPDTSFYAKTPEEAKTLVNLLKQYK